MGRGGNLSSLTDLLNGRLCLSFPFSAVTSAELGSGGKRWGRVRGPSAALGGAGGTRRRGDGGCDLNPDLKGA